MNNSHKVIIQGLNSLGKYFGKSLLHNKPDLILKDCRYKILRNGRRRKKFGVNKSSYLNINLKNS